MFSLYVVLVRYILIVLLALYTFLAFDIFVMRRRKIPKEVAVKLNEVQLAKKNARYDKAFERKKEGIFNLQFGLIIAIHLICFSVLFFQEFEIKVLGICIVELMFFTVIKSIYLSAYEGMSRLLFNNMLMLMDIGFIVLTRLGYQYGIKQFMYVIVATFVSLLIPMIIDKFDSIDKYAWIYGVVGLGLLLIVFIFAKAQYGAKNWIPIAGIRFQPSEFVKIIFVFSMAGLLSKAETFKQILIVTGFAAVHVIVLVLSTDLGAGLLFFVTYLVMLFVATKNKWFIFIGLGSGSLAAVVAYKLFHHVQVRVGMWRNPWVNNSSFYQVRCALYAIAAGGWFGLGLTKGIPMVIPVRESDVIFAVICEELGCLIGILIVLINLSCFIMFVNIAMLIKKLFYKLVAIGLSVTYIMQVLLNVGGTTKFIPLTGVTLPFISHGGTSIICTVFVFSVVQGLYVRKTSS